MAPELQVTLSASECPAFASGVGLAERMPALSEQIGLSLGGVVRSLGMHNPFCYFNSSPEVIRLTLMMYVPVAQLPGLALGPRFSRQHPPEFVWFVIAVGTRIAERPPHRSGRAAFPHPAPTSGA